MEKAPALLVCMGVSGSGKSTLARALAAKYGLECFEADDFHSAENRARMAAGKPLDDSLRGPWIEALCRALGEPLRQGRHCVMAFSGLRRAHRQRVRELGFRTSFLHLAGATDVIRARMQARAGHYMPASLLDSQLADLEPTDHEPDVVNLDVSDDLQTVLSRACDVAERILTVKTA